VKSTFQLFFVILIPPFRNYVYATDLERHIGLMLICSVQGSRALCKNRTIGTLQKKEIKIGSFLLRRQCIKDDITVPEIKLF